MVAEADADLGGAVIDDAARSSLIVNLLTEDNLPYYFRTIERTFGDDGPWGAWSKRWTAEEGRHSMVIYGYLMATRAVDPVALERARMVQVSKGLVPEPDTAAESLVYVALQELATRIAHRNTGRLLGDRAGYDVMMRVAADENLHHLFYRDLTRGGDRARPEPRWCQAIERQVVEFEMPGAGIPGFAKHAAAIARAGIYDLTIHHDQILVPVVLRQWGVEQLTGLDADAEQARDRLMAPPGQERAGRPPHRRAPPGASPASRLTTAFLTLLAPASARTQVSGEPRPVARKSAVGVRRLRAWRA